MWFLYKKSQLMWFFNLINLFLQTYSKNGQVNQQASADRPVSSLLGLVRTLQLVVETAGTTFCLWLLHLKHPVVDLNAG